MSDVPETLLGRPVVVNDAIPSIGEGSVVFGDMEKYKSICVLEDSEGKKCRLVEGRDFVRDPADPSVAILNGGRRVPIQTV